MRWRTLLVVLVTVPLSLVAAALAARPARRDVQRDRVRRPRAAALAVVVDDAVTGAENIARRLRSGARTTATPPVADDRARRDARRSAGRWSTPRSSRCSSIVPLVVLEGRPGAFFAPLAAGLRRGRRDRRRSWP